MIITLARNGRAALISFSIRTGGIFYPPAVMISSLTLPVMKRTPYGVIFPESPEWRKPCGSMVFCVSTGSL
jgi:hypothetical protein